MSSNITINSPNVVSTDESIVATVQYDTTDVVVDNGTYSVTPKTQQFTFKTMKKAPKLGVMLVGLG